MVWHCQSGKRKGAPGKAKGAVKKSRKSGSKVGKDGKPVTRYDNSLCLLTRKFIALVRGAPDGIVDLNKVSPFSLVYHLCNLSLSLSIPSPPRAHGYYAKAYG